jgi:protein gp37
VSKTAIPYAEESWSPVTGCSFGCKWCWSAALAHRFGRSFKPTFHADVLAQPLHWKKPRKVLVCFNGDLFGPEITGPQIESVFNVMAACVQHTFLVLTKRAGLMAEWFANAATWTDPPLPNVWLGVSVTNQADADDRIPHLLKCPAAVRWVSAEPLRSDVNLLDCLEDIDWVAAGAMSGPRAVPCDLDWARQLRDDCAAAGVPFAWKNPTGYPLLDGVVHDALPVVG